MVPITVYNQAVLPQQYVSFVFVPVMVFLHVDFVSRTHSGSLLYQLTFRTGLAVLSLQHRGCTQCFQSTLCKMYYKWPFLKIFHSRAETSFGPQIITHDKPLLVHIGCSPVSSSDSRWHSEWHDKWTGLLRVFNIVVFMLCVVNCAVARCAFDSFVLSQYCVLQLVK
jgi:hypothetical protein